MRSLLQAAVAASCIAFPSLAIAGEAKTTRIETRQFYGATVTLEEGVRVFRPLPPQDRVIINPGGRAPVSLLIEQSRNYGYPAPYAAHDGHDPAVVGSPYLGAPYGKPRQPHPPRTVAKQAHPPAHGPGHPPAGPRR